LADIEPNINLFAFLILFGVVQGFILSLFFLNKKNRLNQPNIFIGLLMMTFSLLSLDIFLCYTGYMSRVIYLDNFSESLSFLFGPLFYLYVISSIKGKIKKGLWLHFLPFMLYAAYNVLYFIQPADFKYVSYINAYFPGQNPEIVSPIVNPDPLHLRQYLDGLIMVQNVSYYIIAIISVINAFKKENVSIFVRRYKNLSWLRNFSIAYFCLFAVFIVVTLLFGDDIGDYLISSFMALIVYGTSVNVIRSSGFFTEHLNVAVSAGRKYARSPLCEEDKMEILKKLRDGMEIDKYYRSNLLSQSQMSKKLLVPVHHISQVINEKLNQSFFEFIAAYRIKDAENLLLDPENNHLTVEEIAEEVGYISKSAFNKTFKKITGKTPSEYRAAP
jgi:AraC-like DNA-binding protein